jgi:hypothetical protein
MHSYHHTMIIFSYRFIHLSSIFSTVAIIWGHSSFRVASAWLHVNHDQRFIQFLDSKTKLLFTMKNRGECLLINFT